MEVSQVSGHVQFLDSHVALTQQTMMYGLTFLLPAPNQSALMLICVLNLAQHDCLQSTWGVITTDAVITSCYLNGNNSLHTDEHETFNHIRQLHPNVLHLMHGSLSPWVHTHTHTSVLQILKIDFKVANLAKIKIQKKILHHQMINWCERWNQGQPGVDTTASMQLSDFNVAVR